MGQRRCLEVDSKTWAEYIGTQGLCLGWTGAEGQGQWVKAFKLKAAAYGHGEQFHHFPLLAGFW